MARQADPDYVTDADRGSSDHTTTKLAARLEPAVATERAAERDGARALDVDVENLPGLTRQQRDRERAMPRDTTVELNPRMRRALPAADDVRRPLSSRQRKSRSTAKRTVQDRLPATQYAALDTAISSPQQWRRINDRLSDVVSDAQALSDDDRVHAQRIDRAIQAYERGNPRTHVVYCNVEIPLVQARDLGAAVGDAFPADAVLCFDRYTGTAHSMHEIEREPRLGAFHSAVFEIQTGRGIYLGRSDSLDDTLHVLPRGIRLRVIGSHLATFQRPDGTTSRRHVIQLTDTDPT